jgi:hypothetical protein
MATFERRGEKRFRAVRAAEEGGKPHLVVITPAQPEAPNQ